MSRRGFCAAAGALAVAPGWAAGAPRPVVPLAVSEAVNPKLMEPLLQLIAEAAGLRWEVQTVPFGRLLMLTEQGQAIGFGISTPGGHDRRLQFSAQVFAGAVWAVSRRAQPVQARRPEDLRGRTVCMSRSASYGTVLDEAKLQGFEAEYVSGDLSRRLRTLNAGHCDALLVTSRNTSAAALRSRLTAAGADTRELFFNETPLAEQSVHFAAAAGSPLAAHLPRIDDALRARRKQIFALTGRVD